MHAPAYLRLSAVLTSLLLLVPLSPPAQENNPPSHPAARNNRFEEKFKAFKIEDHGPGSHDQPTPLKPVQAPPFGDRIDLAPTWLFHAGRNPQFASPLFDDSDWTTLDATRPLFTSMIFGVNEIWYRTHVHLAPGAHDLAISLSGIGGSYRVLVNGRELGGHGLMAGRGEYLIAPSDTFLIPNDLLSNTSDLTIALHLFAGTVDRISFALQTGISSRSTIYLGPASILLRDQRSAAQVGTAASGATLTIWAIVLILALGLAALIPKVPVYRVLALYAAAHLVARILSDIAESNYLSHTHWITWPLNLAFVITVLAALELCRLIAGSPRRLWLTILEVLYAFSIFAVYPAAWGILSYYLYSSLYQAIRIALVPAFLFYVVAGAKRRRLDAIILLATALAFGLYLLAWTLLDGRSFGNSLVDSSIHTFHQRFTPRGITELAFILGFLVVLIVHTLRIIRERAHIASEIQAARTMQQLLLARSSEPTPGFLVDTAYLPAGDVGGDFFLVGSHQATTTREGDLFAIVGDVSGKGLMAAMRVSMILGVLRREPSRDPTVVLCSLNEALLSQSDAGFTTACAVRISRSGHYTIANAGHLSPYLVTGSHGLLTSKELLTPPALPLGIASGHAYEPINGQILPNQRLVLLSDGVPEARSTSGKNKGELYGFDRLLPLTVRTAKEIATTALAFGQEDDITVLTLACIAPTTNQPPPPPPPPSPVPHQI